MNFNFYYFVFWVINLRILCGLLVKLGDFDENLTFLALKIILKYLKILNFKNSPKKLSKSSIFTNLVINIVLRACPTQNLHSNFFYHAPLTFPSVSPGSSHLIYCAISTLYDYSEIPLLLLLLNR